MEDRRICVTGAGGYIASWVVKFLLVKGYKVHGTVRDPSDPKNAHLWRLEYAQENLRLFKADLLDYDAIHAAITGCIGVIHVASPVPASKVPNPEVLYEPAVTGTKNVLNACLKEKVKKVVVVSSVGAVAVNRTWPRDKPMDESCTAKLEWYCASKTMSETEVWEFAKRTGLNIVTVCPSVVIGPMLQPTLNASCLYLLALLKGIDPTRFGAMAFVDIRDTAEAILLAYENPEAEGRYVCSAYEMRNQALAEKLKGMYPDLDYPKSFKEVMADLRLCSIKLQNLGWKYRSLEETLVDAVENYKQTETSPGSFANILRSRSLTETIIADSLPRKKMIE